VGKLFLLDDRWRTPGCPSCRAFSWLANPINFLPMSRSYARPAPHLRLTKVYRRPDMSIDDIRFKLLERDRMAAMDDRSEAAKWLGDPPLHRSALAMKKDSGRL
jgi:hypothetical protein